MRKICLLLLLISSYLYSDNFFTLENYDFEARMDFFNVPGVSITTINSSEIGITKGFGLSNKKTMSPVVEDTLFQAANISKPITALAVLKLVEEGLLDLDVDVNLYLKDWALGRDIFSKNKKFTLRNLLTHTTGIHSTGLRGYNKGEELPSLIDILDGRGNTPKVSVHYFPGKKFRYSWGGYVVIQKVIEDVTGESFAEYMEQNILKPLGMSNSTFRSNLNKDLLAKVSNGHDLFGETISGGWRVYPELASSGLWTTSVDLAKYCLEIEKILTTDYEGIITKNSVLMMLEKHLKSWGLGPSLKFEGNELIFRHSGKSEGYTSYYISRPYNGEAIIIMTNGDNAWKLIMEIINSIEDSKSWGI